MSELTEKDFKKLNEYFKDVEVSEEMKIVVEKIKLINEQIDLSISFQSKFQDIRAKLNELNLSNEEGSK